VGGDPHASGVFEAYTASCATLGRRVRVEMPGGEEVLGQAEAVDEAGRLVVRDAEGVRREVAAGDIVHLR
jgi:BirA family biotin operon repressor/biotin-[acetyl-CoA-carboxylase] ligase